VLTNPKLASTRHAIPRKACAFLRTCDIAEAADKGAIAFVSSLLDNGMAG
jgi:hypothetical protein